MDEQVLWEQLTAIRESIARIEVSQAAQQSDLGLVRSKLDAEESRLYALEQYKASTRAEAEAAMSQARHVEALIAAYDISPSQFKEWKGKVDNVVTAFTNSQLAISIKQGIRRSDLAVLGTLAAFTGMVISRLPDIYTIITGG